MRLNDYQRYKEYLGSYIDNIAKMHSASIESRKPMTFYELMSRRVEVLSCDVEVYDSWWDHDFATGDAIAFHPDGKIKVVPDSARMKGIKAGCKLENGALVLEDGEYESLEGLEMTLFRLERKYGLNRQLSREEVMKHPVWNYMAQGDEVFSVYADIMFTKSMSQLGRPGCMGFFFYEYTDSPSMKPVRVNDFYGYSSFGTERLDRKSARSVGVVEPPLLLTQSLKRLILSSEGAKRDIERLGYDEFIKRINR